MSETNVAGGGRALTDLQKQAEEYIGRYCGRHFAVAEHEEFYDGSGSRWLVLAERPVIEVLDLRDDLKHEFPDNSAIALGQYHLYADEGIIRLEGASFQDGVQNVRVRYRAGYEQLPEDLMLARDLMVNMWRASASGPLPDNIITLVVPYRNLEG